MHPWKTVSYVERQTRQLLTIMFDFHESNKRINRWYTDIKKEYVEVYPKMSVPADRKAFVDKLAGVVTNIQKELDMLNAEASFLPADHLKEDVTNQISVYQMYANELAALVTREQFDAGNFKYEVFDDLKKKQNQLANINFDDKKKTDVRNFKKGAIQQGNELYQEAKDRLASIKENIRVSKERLNGINEEIRQQNIKLLEIDELIKQSQSLFVRAGELIRFFTKTFYKDTIMNLLIGLCLLACVGCIVLVFMAKNAQGSSPATSAATQNTTATNQTASALLAAVAVNVTGFGY
jgi:hypothetical protein